ncbi:MAG: ABC transporter ATP-binding protein [Candidatus Lokiarchaeota archaeon]
MNSWRMIIKYWFKSRRNFMLAFIFQIISVVSALIIPILIGLLVGSLDLSGGTNVHILITYLIGVLILGYISYFFNKRGRLKSAEVSSRALYALRKDINAAINQQSFSYFDKNETGQLVARATSDVNQTQMIFGFGLAVGAQAFITLIGAIIGVLIIEPILSLIFFAIIPTSIILMLLVVKKLRPIYIDTRNAFGSLTNTIRENIVGADVVRNFSKQEKENEKFKKNNKWFYNASVKSVIYNSLLFPINIALIGILTTIILLAGGFLVINNAPGMNISILISLISYVGMINFPLMIFGQIMLFYIQADAALTRIREVLDSSPDVIEDSNPISAKNINGNIIFKNVSFGYLKSNKILKNISFEVKSGKKLAIIGTTGSGKSTIINLLPRFYDINEGTIYIDGIDIKKYVLKDLRQNIGIVSQETFLFNKSIRDNIAYGKEDAPLEEIIQAAKNANLNKFIESLPEKYDTMVGERGTRLSGGQKQRLSIARALIINPKILILDDSTSSVDVETEYKIQEALEKIMTNTTTFIITQRISTIRKADEILVLDKGRVVGLGTHNELIESNVLYKQIYQTLFKKQKQLGYQENQTLYTMEENQSSERGNI